MATVRSPLQTYQPFKSIYLVGYLCTVFARLPYWLLAGAIPSLRPHKQWTAKQSILTRLISAVSDLRSQLGVTDPITMEQGAEGARFQILAPAEGRFYTGPLSPRSDGPKPDPVGATWSPAVPSPSPSPAAPKTIIYYVHGGAFIAWDGRDQGCGFLIKTLLKGLEADSLLSLQYRLSGYSGQNPFPAAFQDCLTGYLHLVKNFDQSRIILAGDSAGANLLIGLLRYIHSYGGELDIPKPHCAVLLSPWVSPFDYGTGPSSNNGHHIDWLPLSFLKFGSTTYVGATSRTDPYITPLGHPFASPVPIFVNFGEEERLRHAIVEWVKEMQTFGNSVEVHVESAGVHDAVALGPLLGFEDSARGVATKAGEFVRRI